MTTQQKTIAATIVAFVILAILLVWGERNRGIQDAKVLGAAMRAENAVAIFRADSARIVPIIAGITRQIEALQAQQNALQIRVILNQKRNENLNKNLDTVNGKLGIRPKF